LGEESESERTHVDRVQLFMPRDVFRDIAPLLDAVRGSVLDTPLGRLLGDYLLAVERRLPELTTADLPRLTTAVHAMVAASIAPSPGRLDAARSQLEFGQLERVRQAVHKYLRSPDLGPTTLCRAVGMSRSHLYRLMESAGGVARYIHRQRLLEAHAAVCDPANTAPISGIAETFCFADASAFSRAFRREFGNSPSEVRSARLIGLPVVTSPHTGELSRSANFGDLLRGF
jgi:AraC-like DNA-binding protein